MLRIKTNPRNNWQQAVEQLGFGFHTTDVPYWDESAYYEFTLAEVEKIEAATESLYQMCLQAVQHIIDNNLFELFKIPTSFITPIKNSWQKDAASIYGRFDLSYKNGEIKMLEFNADTPTSLYEAAIVQWYWLQDFDKTKDQFNSLHEKLIAQWKYLKPNLHNGILHFTCLTDSLEDLTNVEYLRDCAIQANIPTQLVFLQDIGWNDVENIFVDKENAPIKNIFKLYPWEWLMEDAFGNNILNDKLNCIWIEPPWKMLLSNKAILPILWQLFPQSPYLLPAYFTDNGMKDYVKKPLLSREGANIEMIKHYGTIEKTEGEYGSEGFIYQQLFTLPNFENNYPVIGSWLIGHTSAGMGIRESNNLITNNTSRFVPHLIV